MIVSTAKVESAIHQASKLFFPCASNSPKLGVEGGTPRPRKSRLVNERMAALIEIARLLARPGDLVQAQGFVLATVLVLFTVTAIAAVDGLRPERLTI